MKITRDKLKQILDNHQHWLNKDVENWKDMRADLSCLDLSKANLHGADLRHALLYKTDLRGAYLTEANLKDADLSRANLGGADLYLADMSYARLSNANLYNAFLFKANLRDAIIDEANLATADLRGANLRGAALCGSNLRGADLSEAHFYNANLCMAKNVPFIPSVCPETGSFICYKKANQYIIELEVTSDAKRSSATTRKCRCSKAKVLSIQYFDGTKANLEQTASDWDSSFIYKLGEIVEVKNFDKDRWNECAPGIHFFMNRQEAVEY